MYLHYIKILLCQLATTHAMCGFQLKMLIKKSYKFNALQLADI